MSVRKTRNNVMIQGEKKTMLIAEVKVFYTWIVIMLLIVILIDQCPPRFCHDWEQRCSRDELCRKYYNDAIFYCHTVFGWQDNQPEPKCMPACQRAIDRLASVTNHTMGDNVWCCRCGNYSDLRNNNLDSIRKWGACKRKVRNVNKFCKLNCTNCARRQPTGNKK